MTLKQFIEGHDVEFTLNLIDEAYITDVEEILKVKVGIRLKEYILNYGYLGFKDIELYGINSKQAEKSDMIRQTEYLHKYFESTSLYIALENCGEGEYILVDSEDNIYRYDSESDELIALGVKIYSYILNRFIEAE